MATGGGSGAQGRAGCGSRGPTGAGKTFVFELLVKSGALRGQAVYTVPTRALANDKWRTWKAAGWQVGIATGDLAVDTGARGGRHAGNPTGTIPLR